MNQEPSPTWRIQARPADRSLAAYKEFILAIPHGLDPDAVDDHTGEWWLEAWREFWSSADRNEV